MANSDVTLALLAAFATQGRTPNAEAAEAEDSLLAIRAACMLIALQHKVPAKVLATCAGVLICPDLVHSQSEPMSVGGLYIARDAAYLLKTCIVRLAGSGVGRIRQPGGLVVVAPEPDVGQAILTGRVMGSGVNVRPGPLREERLDDAATALCWFMHGSTLCPGTVSEVFLRHDDTPLSPDNAALLDIISAVFRKAEQRSVGRAGGSPSK